MAAPPGDQGISRREGEVLDLVRQHLTNAEIASRLYISERTVESHVSSLLRKLGVSDRRQLARRAPGPVAAAADRGMPPVLELLADPSTFVGRTWERGALRALWERARSGQTLIGLVSGEPGIGKSRIVAELAAEVHAGGGRVLLGACHEDADEPYGPFVQAIVEDAAQLRRDELTRRSQRVGDTLGRLSPELATLLGVRSAGGEVDGSDRAGVLEGLRQWLVESTTGGPVLLVIEDVHWSTPTTRDLLRQFARRPGRSPLLVVATTRDTKPDLDPDAVAFLAALESSPATVRVPLGGLGPDDVARLAGARREDAAAIFDETHGNPLLVTHLTSDVRRGTLPVWLHERERSLDQRSRDVLDQAATFGAEFDADLLALAVGEPLLDVLDSLEAAEEAGLIVPNPPKPAAFRFVHALFRSHRYDALALRRRLELHARAATALAARPDDTSLLAEHARHACLGVPVVPASAAIDLSLAAAQHDERSYAYEEAVSHYRRALDAARLLEPPDPALELDLTIRVGAGLHHAGKPAGLGMLLDAARRAKKEGRTDALVRAALAIPQFGAVGFVDPMHEGRAVTEAALEAIGDEPTATRARLLMDLASHWLFVRVDEALALAAEAEDIARRLDDPEVLGTVLLAERHLLSHPSRLGERVRVGSELDALGRRLDRLAFRLAGTATLAIASFERGDLASWANGFRRVIDLLGERQLGFFQMQAMNFDVIRAVLAGDLERAERLAADTVPVSLGIGAGRTYYEAAVVACRRLQGRDAELVSRFERAAGRSDDLWYRCSLAAAQARSGDVDAARVTLDEVAARGFAIREIYPWSVAVTDLAEAAEVADVPSVAAHVLSVGGSFTGRIAASGPNPNRPFDQALAQASLAVGDVEGAITHATAAVSASRERGTPVFLARELVLLAEARRRGGATASEIRPHVTEALVLADRFALGSVVADIARYALPC